MKNATYSAYGERALCDALASVMPKPKATPAAANVFTPVSGGVMFPLHEDDENSPYTVIPCSDDEAPKLARWMRVESALVALGFPPEIANRAAEDAAMHGGGARDMLNRAIRIAEFRVPR